ncbi:MAG: hypothetical protein Kow006_04160 [Gammaproteobacteria bacterium]
MSVQKAQSIQRNRLLARTAFFLLFVFAPPLDIFRLDLNLGHLIFFGQPWTLGGGELIAGEISATQAALKIILYGFVPLVVLVGTAFYVSWRFGRVYCGWLCPHFSVVEVINSLMRRASGKPTLWEKEPLPERQPDGHVEHPDRRYWIPALLAISFFAFLWAVVLLTYLLPPREIYGNLLAGTLTRNQTVFLTAATVVFFLEFLLARHLFCRFGCAVGLFQSYVWIFNKRAMVVGFDHTRKESCIDCNAACDNVCPMRLKPRSIKRKMFACTECGRCIQACNQVQADNPQGSLLQWVSGECARDVSERDFGRKYVCYDESCFLKNREVAPAQAVEKDAECCGGGCSDEAVVSVIERAEEEWKKRSANSGID